MHRKIAGRWAVLCFFVGSLAVTSARDYFTEQFTGDFDLVGNTFTFKPDRSSNGYAVCRLPATEFPTPTSQTTLAVYLLEPHPLLAGSDPLPLYGERYSQVWVNTNGSITFGAQDPSDVSTLANHFRLARISAGLGMLEPYVQIAFLSNRIAVTWSDQPFGPFPAGTNAVQVELFYDGVIRMTFLRMDTTTGIVGFSPGGGVPADYVESNLSAIGCAGQALYELVWSGVPSNVQAGQPFPVSLFGRDAFNLDFPVNGPARLSAVRPAVLFETDFETGTGGFTFSNAPGFPGSNLWHRSTFRGTQVGHSPSHSLKFGRFDDAPPTNNPVATGLAVSPEIDLRAAYPPITLSFNHLANFPLPQVSVKVQLSGSTNQAVEAAAFFDFPINTANTWITSTVDLSPYAGKRIRVSFFGNTNTLYTGFGDSFWLVDDVRITGLASNVAVTPSVTGPFTGNAWSGNISVDNPGLELRLLATHSNGVYGLSAPINVGAANDLHLNAVMKFPNLLLGRTGSVDIAVSNSGPDVASNVIVTNQLPPGITLGNIAVSQGSATVNGNNLLLNFGPISGGGYALASFEFTPTQSGTRYFTSVVARSGSEMFLENNVVVTHVNVGEPGVTVSSPSAVEGGAAVFLLTLDSPTSVPVSVRFATVSGTAIAGEDFVPTNGFVIFAPFATNAEVPVAIIDDDLFEGRNNDPKEFFFLELTSATNAYISNPFGTASITDNDPAPQLTVIATNVVEGNSGTTNVPVLFRISKAAGVALDVTYRTETGLEFDQVIERERYFGTAFENVDYVHQQSTFFFTPGETQRIVHVSVIGDTNAEPDEYFTVVVSSQSMLPLQPTRPRPPHLLFAPITIIDDEPPVLAADNYELIAENCGTNNGAVDPGETVTVRMVVRNAGYGGCTSPNLTVTLLPGGGIVNPSGPQTYGALCETQALAMPFTFTASAACGSNLVATLAFHEGTTNRGIATVLIPVGQRSRSLYEDFESATPPNMPMGWTAPLSGNAFWNTKTEPPEHTNQFAAAGFGTFNENAAILQSPPFPIVSSNAWLKIRHRFNVAVFDVRAYIQGVNSNDFIQNGYIVSNYWNGSSQGWITSLARLPASWAGTTQSLTFVLYKDFEAGPANWDIDWVEVVDGSAVCCDGTLPPMFTSIRRTNGSTILGWNTVSNQVYQLQFRPNLSPAAGWSDIGAPIVGQGFPTGQTHSSTSPQGYYRLEIGP